MNNAGDCSLLGPSRTGSSEFAVATIVHSWESASYAHGAATLGWALRRFCRECTRVLVHAEHDEPSADLARTLRDISGWQRCFVSVAPLGTAPASKKSSKKRQGAQRVVGAWSKLSLFSWTQFARVLYLDSDTLPVADVTTLLSGWPMRGASLAAMGEVFYGRGAHSADWFNCGVMLLVPNATLHASLVHFFWAVFKGTQQLQRSADEPVHRGGSFLRKFSRGALGDSDLVNSAWRVLGLERSPLPLSANAHLAAYDPRQPNGGKLWREAGPKLILHYTMQKPWRQCKGQYEQFCASWSCLWDEIRPAFAAAFPQPSRVAVLSQHNSGLTLLSNDIEGSTGERYRGEGLERDLRVAEYNASGDEAKLWASGYFFNVCHPPASLLHNAACGFAACVETHLRRCQCNQSEALARPHALASVTGVAAIAAAAPPLQAPPQAPVAASTVTGSAARVKPAFRRIIITYGRTGHF